MEKFNSDADKLLNKKRTRSDVEMALIMASSNLKTSSELQQRLGLSKSQCNKRIKAIKEGGYRTVSVVVRCQDCCRFLYRFDDIKLPTHHNNKKECDCC